MAPVRWWLAAALVAPVLCPAASAGTVSVGDGWFRALPAGLPSAGYFKLHNAGGKPAVLVGAQSPACGMLMLHMTMRGSGMEHMMAVDAVEVAPGQTFAFAPGGYHLMCMNPGKTMKPGATVAVTLRFSDGSSLTGAFAVKGAGGR